MPTLNFIYVLLALQALDLISTVIALRNPNVSEANPFLAPLFKQFGALPTLLVLKSAFAVFLYFQHALIPDQLIWIACAGYAWVVVNNFKNAK